MGKLKYLDNVGFLFDRSIVVDAKSIAMIVKRKRVVEGYAKQLIRNLLLKNKINKLAKGCYTKFDDPSLVVFCLNPAYLGLQDALSMHGLWEQETVPVVITARNARQGIRNVLGNNVLVRRLNKKYFFGYDFLSVGGFDLPYSDLEKTFIDMIYFKVKIRDDVLKKIVEKLDRRKLDAYLKFYPVKIRERVNKLIG